MYFHGRITFLILFAIALALVEVSTSHAITQETEQGEQDQSSPSLAKDPQFNLQKNPITIFLRALTFIIVAALLLYLMLRAYKALTLGGGFGRQSPEIRVLSSSAIGPKKSLCLVNVLDHVLLLGVTDGEISVLLQTPTEELNEEMKNSLLRQRGSNEPNFKKLVSNFLKK